MTSFVWARWLRSLFRSRARTRRNQVPVRRMVVEPLEVRLAPATFTWTGNVNGNWNVGGNWQGGAAPSGSTASLDDLVFPAGARNVNTFNNITGRATFNSITISGAGYNLAGNQITLGDPSKPSGGFLISNAVGSDTVSLDVVLGGASGVKQFFTVTQPSATLTISGELSGSTGSELTKEGVGTLILSGNNDDTNLASNPAGPFTGPISIDNNAGILEITNSNALGDTSQGTTVGTNSQLMIVGGVNGLNINENLLLNGAGPAGNGALLNQSGSNTLNGTVELDSDTTLGSSAGNLTITGVISDNSSGHNLTKEGVGQITFTAANTYRGLTSINNGILEIDNPLALGSPDGSLPNGSPPYVLGSETAAAGTVVTSQIINGVIVETGTLQLNDSTDPNGFTVLDEELTLNGPGFNGLGALNNLNGPNTWASTHFTLGSPAPQGQAVSIGAQNTGAGNALTISSKIVDRSGGALAGSLSKVGAGEVIFNNANTYSEPTDISTGTLDIRDSQALGSPAGGGVTVENGAVLQLDVDSGLDAHGRNLSVDSVTGVPNKLSMTKAITINGQGVINPQTGKFTGALYSATGINSDSRGIALGGNADIDAIGVDPDPHPRADANYLTSDYSLTISGVISGGKTNALAKVGGGNLILTSNNSYTSDTYIEQGWITAENNGALGAPILGIAETIQSAVMVLPGAALHLLAPTPGGSINLTKGLVLAGDGISHPYPEISGKGALMSLGGNNTVSGAIQLNAVPGFPQAGIGVQTVSPATVSNLTLTGTLSDYHSYIIRASQGPIPDHNIVDIAATQGSVTIGLPQEPFSGASIQAFTPPAPAGSAFITLNGGGTATNSFGPNASGDTRLDLVAVGNPTFYYAADVQPTGIHGGITKFGAGRLGIFSAGTYTGNVEVAEGVLTVRNDTALGAGTVQNGANPATMTSTTVDTGAALEMQSGLTTDNGGISAGIAVWGESLVLNGPGYTDQQTVTVTGTSGTFTLTYNGATTNPLAYNATAAQVAAELNNLPTISGTGTVSVAQNGNVYTVTFNDDLEASNPSLLVASGTGGATAVVAPGESTLVNVDGDNLWRGPTMLGSDVNIATSANSRLTLFGAIDDDANLNPAGSALTKLGTGELALYGVTAFNGVTSTSDYRGVTTLTAGVTTLESSQALGSPAGGTVLANNATLQLQGSISVAGEPLTLLGNGTSTVPNVPVRWFSVGPASSTNGVTQPTTSITDPVSGRVTGIAPDPTDPNVIYISAGGGGVWKTIDGGQTWHPLTDQVLDVSGNPILDPATNLPINIWAGSIVMAPTNSQVLYVGLGEGDYSADSHYGHGILKSIDGGIHWTLMQGTAQNEFDFKVINKIVVDPKLSNVIYVAVGNSGDGHASPNNGGIWKFDGTSWTDLTAQVSITRQSQSPPVNVPGPDDDFATTFRANADWTSLVVYQEVTPGRANNRFIIASQGTQSGGDYDPANKSYSNGSFVSLDDGQSWVEAKFPTTDSQSINGVTIYYPHSGKQELAGADTPSWPNAYTYYAAVTTPDNAENSDGNNPSYGNTGQLERTIEEVDQGTITWDANKGIYVVNNWTTQSSTGGGTLPYYAGTAGPFTAQGQYDSAIVVEPNFSNILYVGGSAFIPGGGSGVTQPGSMVSTDGGKTWSPFGAGTNGHGPAQNYHALVIDSAGNLLAGTDGGIWSLALLSPSTPQWQDINGNLTTGELNGVAASPTDPSVGFASGQGVGVSQFNGSQTQTQDLGGDGGLVAIDPVHPNVVYAQKGGALFKSTSGGGTTPTSWTQVQIFGGNGVVGSGSNVVAPNGSYVLSTLPAPDPGFGFYPAFGAVPTEPPSSYPQGTSEKFPFVLDSVNTSRLLVGGADNILQKADGVVNRNITLAESLDQGNSWTEIGGNIDKTIANAFPGWHLAGAYGVALAAYQGDYVADPGFTDISDRGANTYDPNTIYLVTVRLPSADLAPLYGGAQNRAGYFYNGHYYYGNGTGPQVDILVSKDHGQSWQVRTPNLASFPFTGTVDPVTGYFTEPITDLEVDPRNRDTIYAVSNAQGLGKVFVSTDAGRSWTDISAGLPDQPANKLVIDPRTSNLYLGTGTGVWELPGGVGTWQPFGVGLPTAPVTDLTLNQNLNILTIGTSGRGMFQAFLDDIVANGGALRAVSGSSVWTGPITMQGDTTFAAAGTQALQNGIAAAQINIVGPISDATPGANYKVTKLGQGTVIFSGDNTYGGLTEVKEGVLVSDNPMALGGTANGTLVDQDATLELAANLDAEPISLIGDGVKPLYNGHNVGALRNIANTNTYSGTLTLLTSATIGVDTGSQLTITGSVVDGGANLNLTKELTGTLVLAGNNTYGGQTIVSQGALAVANNNALGTTTGNTLVADGAQLQIQQTLDPVPQPVTVTGETLLLTGSGINGTGSLLDTGGNNTWAGPITLQSTSTIGTSNPGDTLTINGVINQSIANATFALNKVGQGRVTLAKGNSYAGLTTVFAGALRIQDPAALGFVTNGTVVLNGASLEVDGGGAGLSVLPEALTLNGNGPVPVQTVTLSGGTGTFTLTFNGQTTKPLATNSAASLIVAALNGLSSIGGVGGSVSVIQNGSTYTITFGGSLAQTDVPQLVASTSPGVVATVSTVVMGGQGALRNVSGSNTWQGAITLASNSAIGADAGSQLTITANIGDPATLTTTAASLTKVGLGTVVFPNANTYGGSTFVNEGILNIRNAKSLGNGAAEVQAVSVSGTAGSFTLTFNGATTSALALNNSTLPTAAQVQSALNALPTIGGLTPPGSVTVTLSGNVYTVTFGGSLFGVNVPQMTLTGSGGASGFVNTTRDGSGVVVVNSGGTLQLQGGISVSTKNLTLNGPGFSNQGALDNAAGSNNTWAAPLTLGSNASLGADGGLDTLTISQPIGDNGSGFGLNKFGPGTVDYKAANTYTGVTTVNAGTLLLDNGSGQSLAGNLTIGDGVSGPAVATWAFNDQVPNSATVLVNSNGNLNLNGKSDTIGSLQMVDGQGTTGTNGVLTVGGVNMTGGTFTVASGGQLVLAGNVTATSDALEPAVLTGSGTVSLGGATRTITVNDGPQPSDLIFSAAVAGLSNEGLTKTGTGRLELDAVNSYTGPTTISQGDLEVDGSLVSNSVLNGGTLSGTGTAAAVDGTAGGTINPGHNGLTLPFGILTAGNQTWNSKTTFFVNVTHTTVGTPVAGVDFDQLVVHGNVSLNGAVLSGTIDPTVQIGDQFTVLKTVGGTISGRFKELPGTSDPSPTVGIVFIGGQKFTVDYTDPTQVTLTRTKVTSKLAVGATPNPALFGQDVVFSATVTPEVGASAVPTTDTVTFVLDPGTPNQVSKTVTVDNTGTATFDPTLVSGKVLSVGTHTLIVTFNGDTAYAAVDNSSAPYVETVNKALTSIKLTVSPTTVVFGQNPTATAVISVIAPGAGIPTGTVTFVLDGKDQSPAVAIDSTGKASLTLTGLSTNLHRIQARYSGDGNFKGINTTQDVLLTVQPDAVTVGLSAAPTTTVYGQSTTFTAVVAAAAPGAGTPTGKVTFYDGSSTNSPQLGTVNVDASGKATLNIATLTGGTHTITASYNGDSNFLSGSNSIGYVVTPDATATTVKASDISPVFGETVAFTATVTPATSPIGTPSGTVTFRVDGQLQPATTMSNGQAVLSLSNLTLGSHTITATYNSDSNFTSSTSQAISILVVQDHTTTTITSTPAAPVFGQAVTFTATVAPVSPGSGTPTGTVTFSIANTPQGTVKLDSNGQASITLSNLVTGQNVIVATYNGDANYTSSTSPAFTEQVSPAVTTTKLTETITSSVYGQSVSFFAQVNVVAPGQGSPTGTVTFTIDSTNQQKAPLNASGQASLTLNNLPAGSHLITATYDGDTNFASSTSPSVSQNVSKDSTNTTLISSVNPGSLGQPILFTAKVLAAPPGGGIPTGSVTFTFNSVNGQTTTVVPLDSTGQAVLTRSDLATGSYTITAKYSGDSNYNVSQSPLLSESVFNGSSTTLTESTAASVFGQPVIFTINVAAVPPATGTPSGSVILNVDGTDLLPAVGLVNGSASITLSNLPVAAHTIYARYSGDSSFVISSSPVVPLTVSQDSTTTTLTPSSNPSGLGQPVTFTATVTANAPGTGVPTGKVTFNVDGVDQTPAATLDANGQATLVLSNLSQTAHTVFVKYSGDADYTKSQSTPLTQNVEFVSAIGLTALPTVSVFGQTVTFTAVVGPVPPATGLPTGTVTFIVDGKAQAPMTLDSSAQATLSLSNLGVGSHTVSAKYNGDSNFAVSTSQQVSELVNQAKSTTVLTSTSSTALTGQKVTFTATVKSVAPGNGHPGGTMTYFVDGNALTAVRVNSAGVATFTTSFQTRGVHTVTAEYSGDVNFLPSRSLTLQPKAVAVSSTVLTEPFASSVYGQAVVFTANVKSVIPGAGTPTGSVAFTVDGKFKSRVKVNKMGQALFSLEGLQPGTHSIKALYSGDSNFSQSTSKVVVQKVSRDGSLTSLTTSASLPPVGSPITFTASVTARAPGSGTPTGTVTFSIDGRAVQTVALVAGKASFVTSTLAVGRHQVTAKYNADTHFAGSTSAVLVETVADRVTHLLGILSTTGTQQPPFPITVEALDAGNRIVNAYSGETATLTIQDGPSGGVLSGTTTATFANGVATFSGVSLSVSGTYHLTITTPDGFTTTIEVVTSGRSGG